MKLKYIDDEGNAEFRVEINSVFDICWYTLARMIAANAPHQDENFDYGGDRWKDETLGVCANCGSFFLNNNSVKKYCDNASCKAARIRNNVRALRERRKNSN